MVLGGNKGAGRIAAILVRQRGIHRGFGRIDNTVELGETMGFDTSICI
jgi:hypothetical protein